MEMLYDFLKVLHVISFVFMSLPLFNLIIVNERARLGSDFSYPADKYMENILKGGAPRCFAFQATVAVTGVLLLILGPLGIEALWGNWIILTKTLLLIVVITMLSQVHFVVQPRIDALISQIDPEKPAPEEIIAELKPLRARRKKMASICLFIVLTIIVVGLQTYYSFLPLLTVILIALCALFAWRAYNRGVPTGWF